ncbi:MAG: DNA repair protein RadC [Geminicoccaceae bacterium]|nr:DNA repair protein RadC [Geminicoccaceae bacterium]MCS7268902.1 DNA repair protein RadC [Geminicoccaceae bacterium]MCX7629979.1 DNA repair protein RadC [Geminicoccaceae bacterium]MDW8125397.1 DNA repair protein RadC [Geminicoccaceae bacterium]MDW8342435.1 DNA repair protein RadC [Geminicoccaceae bacterium]
MGEGRHPLEELREAERRYRSILRALHRRGEKATAWEIGHDRGEGPAPGLAEDGRAYRADRTFAIPGPNGLVARLLDNAPGAVEDAELLQILIFLVSPRAAADDIAQRLIERFGSLGAVLAAAEPDLLAVPGVAPEVPRLFRTVRTTLARLLQEPLRQRPVIGSFNALLDYLTITMRDEPVEMVRILFLDRKNQLIKDEIVARGTVDHTPLYPREVLKRCLDHGASAIVLVHNHPSGDPEPSEVDIQLTRQLCRALATLEIALHDHVVIGRGRWTSFRERGFL